MDEDPNVVRVARLSRRRDVMLPSLALAAAAMALVGFLVGYRAGPGPAAQASPTVTAPASPTSRTSTDPSPTPGADATACPGPCVSAFLASFSPATIVAGLPGGGDCTTRDFSGLGVGSNKVVRSWTINCPLGIDARSDFVNAVIEAILPLIPNQTEAGWSTDEFGSAMALFSYADGAHSGTLTVTADSAPPGYEIVVTIVEGAGP